MSPRAARMRVRWPAATPVILGFLCYQFFLCIVNANAFGVSNAIVAVCEAGLLGWATLRAAPSCRFHEMALALFMLTYFMAACAVRGDVDLDGPRNLAIILVCYALGRMQPDREAADKLVWLATGIVMVFAAAEYFLSDSYLHYVNIMRYYTARGLMSSGTTWVPDNTFTSGFRPQGRNLLPFLGDRRISSVFLEPVSMGNYAIIVCLWALSFDAKEKWRAAAHFIAALVLIVACDSRFASLLVFFLLFLRFVPVAARRGVIFALPLVAVGGLLLFTHLGLGNPDDDNLTGRLMRSGLATLDLSFAQVMGVGTLAGLADMGVAYTLEHFGLPLCILLWILFARPVLKDARARRFRLMLAVYALSILFISGTSFYSSKTAAILWFLYGVLLGRDKSLPAERQQPQGAPC
ncbi:MAG: hypothetical protein P4M15_11240 [Alphaproteobacteria bacterium]|nr:hypothetical protein [Alphaproteobacteria bacterium]